MKKISFIFLILIFYCGDISSQGKLTPSQILAKAVAAIENTKGVEVKFTVYNSGYSNGGNIKISGNKFTVTLPDVMVWYNGKDLYTYNRNSDETTVVYPTEEELAESNPLAYVSVASKKYSVDFSTVKKSGRYVLELLPKNKKEEIKRITLTLRQSDFIPEKIVVEPKSGNPVTAEISSFKTGISIPLNEFEYPKSKYPKIEIIDLR